MRRPTLYGRLLPWTLLLCAVILTAYFALVPLNSRTVPAHTMLEPTAAAIDVSAQRETAAVELDADLKHQRAGNRVLQRMIVAEVKAQRAARPTAK